MTRWVRTAGVALALFSSSPRAHANGRFPNATQLVASPADPKHFLLRTTYGVIQSFDGGATWSWSCERAVGYSGVFDPAFVITGTGTIVAGLLDGIARSTDRACDWQRVPSVAGQYVIDLALDTSNPLRVVGVTAGSDTTRSVVVETVDGGATWAVIASLDGDLRPETIDVAPSDSKRVYVSGSVVGAAGAGAFLRSDDAGRTFMRETINLRGGRAPFIAAVDPTNADRVYVRINVEDPPDGGIGGDHLVRTWDAGASFQPVATTTGEMLGVALSPDGKSLAFGGPRDGISIASTADWTTRRASTLAARCLAWRPEGLYVCIPEGPFTVGVSTDDGASFRRFYSVTKVRELKCAQSTSTGSACPVEWPGIYSMTDEDTVAPTDAGAPPTRVAPTDTSTRDGCTGCATPSGERSVGGALAVALVGAVLRRRRR